MKTQISILAMISLASCSTPSYHDRDRNDPYYHNGGSTVLFPLLPSAKPLIGDEKLMPTRSIGGEVTTNTSPEQMAVAGVVLSGISLALNRDYYKSSYISGRCSCRAQKEREFEIPCSHVSVILQDLRGNQISQLYTDDGEFVFPVEKGKLYQIKVDSNRYEIASAKTSPVLEMGDSIVLPLMEKVPTLSE